MDIESKRRIIVGVNAFQPALASKRKVQVLPEKLQGERVRRLAAIKAERGSVKGDLERLRSAAQKGENLLPSIASAVRGGCTVGEISDVLRDLYGVYRPRQHF